MATLVRNRLIDQKLPNLTQVTGKIPLLLKRILLAVIILSLSRIVFVIVNWNAFHISSIGDLLIMIWGGIRFDLTLILRTQWIIVLLHLWPGDYKYTFNAERLIFALFLFLNGILIAFNLVDAEYFDFIHKRSTYDVFLLAGVGNDIVNMIPMFLGNFWYLALIWLSLMMFLVKVYPKDQALLIPRRGKKVTRFIHAILTIIVIGFFLLIGKGKVNGFLNMKDAIQFTDRVENIPVVLNTPFCIIESVGGEQIRKQDIIYAKNESYQSFANKHFGNYSKATQKNVVIIILESFSAEYSKHLSGLEEGYTPFLDSLMQEGLYFTNAFANGKKSIEAVPSIMCGVPALMTNPVIVSNYNKNKYNSIASVLKENGYQTSFYHGAANGSMGFENFTLRNGFDTYKGMSQYPYNDGFDGNWGIEDEKFLQFFADDLDSVEQPFMAGVFTISSHHPYTIPDRYQDTFPEGSIPMLRSIAYADHSLRKFFETAKTKDWYDNTLFVLTADHTGKPYTDEFSNVLQNYRVPLVFFAPGDDKLNGRKEHVAQQIDIFPSVIDYLGIDENIVAQGQSVFVNNKGFAVNYLNNIYQLIDGSYLLQYDGREPVALYKYTNDSALENNLLSGLDQVSQPMLERLNTVITDYHYRMEFNCWMPQDNIPPVFYTFNEKY
jgi:phosphoglycerol transferase MdoB-like AlkP superfamily enzyme